MSSNPSSPTEHPPSALPIGTRLGEFELTRVLGVGGFGIVYLAFDHALHREVAVKEYMPLSLAGRTETLQVSLRSQSDAETFALGLRSFVNEARLLARFDHPSLVKVHRFWEANGTAYMAMPAYRGQTLKQVRAGMAAAPDEAWLRGMLLPLLGAIDKLHGEGVYHRDIAPDNIQIEADGRPVLLDFGAARHVIADKSQALTAILKPAYAPIEQYGEAGSVRQGPWTDLYALGATLHYMLLDRPPPPATARALHDDLRPLAGQALADCSAGFLGTIDWMLAPRPADRPQSVAALLDVLEGRVAPPQRLQPPAEAPAAWERTQVLAAAAPDRAHTGANVVDMPDTIVKPPSTIAPPSSPPFQPPSPPLAPLRQAARPAATAPGRSMRGFALAGSAVLLLAAGGWWLSAPRPGVTTSDLPPPAAASAMVDQAPPVNTAVPVLAPPLPASERAVMPPDSATAAAPVAAPPGPDPTVVAAPRPAQQPTKPASPRPVPTAAVSVANAKPVVPTEPMPPAAAASLPAVVSTAAPVKVLSPKESCGSRVLLALWNCIERQCRKAELRQHPDCVELRIEQERRANPTQ
jgi:serine/threonine protein kinase